MAQNLINSGAISSNSITLQAEENIDNIGGQIRGGDTVSLLAGQNIDSQTTTRTDGMQRWTNRQAGPTDTACAEQYPLHWQSCRK
jgi:filamentous hemagglutinin